MGTNGLPRRLDQQLVSLAIAPAKRTPTYLDGLETARDGLVQVLAQWSGLIKRDAAIRLNPVAVVAAQKPGDGLFANLAHQVPECNIDAADGMLDRTAAPLPEGALPQLLADSGRL